MKTLLLGLSLSLAAFSATAQETPNPQSRSDYSTVARTQTPPLLGRSTGPLRERLAVKASDVINVSVRVHTGNSNRPSAWGTLAGSALAGGTTTVSSPKSELGKTPTLAWGMGLTLAPGLLKRQAAKGSDASLRINVYDANGRFLTQRTHLATNKARRGWEELSLTYQANENGFVEVVLTNEKAPPVAFANKQITQSTRLGKPVPVSGRTPRLPKAALHQEGGISELSAEGGGCIDWYWVTYIDGQFAFEEFSHRTCGGGGGTSESEAIPYLNKCEVAFAATFSAAAVAIAINKSRLEDYINNNDQWKNEWQGIYDGTKGNAIKHAVWNLMNICSVGRPIATLAASIHEECLGQNMNGGVDLVERDQNLTMDMHNNTKGQQMSDVINMSRCWDITYLKEQAELYAANGVLIWWR